MTLPAQTATPKTDAAAFWIETNSGASDICVVEDDFARTLEADNARLAAALRDLLECFGIKQIEGRGE